MLTVGWVGFDAERNLGSGGVRAALDAAIHEIDLLQCNMLMHRMIYEAAATRSGVAWMAGAKPTMTAGGGNSRKPHWI